MDIDVTGLLQLLEFSIQLLIFYIPCTLGAVSAYYVKKELYKNETKMRKKLKSLNLKSAFFTSIMPAVIMTMLSSSSIIDPIKDAYKFGLAFFIGVIGEDISRFLLSFRNVLLVLKAFANGADGIKSLTDKIADSDESSTNNTNTEKKESTEMPTKND